ncbi:MAG: hypothetical protein MJZ20_02980 [Bacteroidaceae bacterium]|nr:hypothetical protein [Bacteroidaceae bacterium]
MYTVRDGCYQDFVELNSRCIEPGEIDPEYDYGPIYKTIECDGRAIAVFNLIEMDDGVVWVSCEFDKDLRKHLRAVLQMIRNYLLEPCCAHYLMLCTCVQADWKVGQDFLERLGFVAQKELEKHPVNNVEYKIYRRAL